MGMGRGIVVVIVGVGGVGGGVVRGLRMVR